MTDLATVEQSTPVVTLRPGRLRFGGYVLLMALFALFGVLMVLEGRATGWFVLGVTLPTGLIFMWVLLSGRVHLRLTPSGFDFGTLRERISYSWTDVEYFGVCDFAHHRWVCFVFSRTYPCEARVRTINQAFGGFDRFLPDTYGMRPEELAELLEEWRLRFGNESGR